MDIGHWNMQTEENEKSIIFRLKNAVPGLKKESC